MWQDSARKFLEGMQPKFRFALTHTLVFKCVCVPSLWLFHSSASSNHYNLPRLTFFRKHPSEAVSNLISPQNYVPTVFENYTASFEIDKQRIELNMWDTSGEARLPFVFIVLR